MKINYYRSIIYLACCTAAGAVGFYAGRATSTSAPKTAAAKTHAILAVGGGRVVGASAASDRAMVEDFLKSKGKPDALKLAEWAKSLSPAECSAYLNDLQKLPPGLQRDSVLEAVIGSWAGKDPQGFLAATKSISGPQMREGGVDAALKSWAAQDPQKALQWIKDNPGDAPTAALNARYVSAIAGYAATDPQAAFAAVNALGEGTLSDQRLKTQALQAVMGSLADQGKFTDASTMLATLPDNSPLKNRAYNQLASSWAQSNPQDASAWVATLTDPQMRENLGGQVAAQWAATDPSAAAAWAAQMDAQASAGAPNGGGPSNYLLADAMRTWAAYDLDAPAAFLNQLPASPDKDGAVATFAIYAAQEDPAGAMNWVNTIGDDQMRQRLAMATALEWSQTDPSGYQQFLSTTNVLTPQQKQMLNNVPPRFGQFLTGGYGGGFGGQANNNPGGIPQRVQDFIINGGGVGGRGGMFGGFGQNNGGYNQPASTGTIPANQNGGPNVILSQRATRRGRNGG